jgi:MoxR-like ATPase
MIEFGASPRGPIGLVAASRALALLRGRAHVEVQDIRDLTPDLLRHRIVLSYDALSDGVTADELVEQVLATVPQPGARRLMRAEREDRSAGGLMGA